MGRIKELQIENKTLTSEMERAQARERSASDENIRLKKRVDELTKDLTSCNSVMTDLLCSASRTWSSMKPRYEVACERARKLLHRLNNN